MASTVYTSGLAKCNGMATAANFLTDTWKSYLVISTYVPNVDHDFFSDVTEIGAVSGYTPGYNSVSHPTLTSKTIAVDDTLNKITYDAADVSFGSPATGATIGGWAIYKPVTVGTDSPVLVFVDATDTPTNGAALTGVFDVLGMLTIQN